LGNKEIHWRLQLRVLPESAPPFDAMVHALLPQLKPAAAQAQAADPVDRLERLAASKDRGLITDEEFAQQKRRIRGES